MESYKIISFNIRYINDIDGMNSWENRRPYVMNIFKEHNPIIFGVQEAYISQVLDIAQDMQDYKWVGIGRNDGKDKGEHCAIFYNEKILNHEYNKTAWLSETPEIPGSLSWDSSLPRIVTKAVFTVKKTNKKLVYFNTHFDHMGEISRLNSAKIIKAFVQEHENDGVIVSGDLNLTPDTKEYTKITKDDILIDAMYSKDIKVIGEESTFHDFDDSNFIRIDYILTNKNIKSETYTNIKFKKINGIYASDHFPIMLEFSLK